MHASGAGEAELKRRQFIATLTSALTIAVTGVAIPLMCGPTHQQEDGYSQEFFERIGARVGSIVREQGRGLRSLEIAPPEIVEGVRVRRCNLRLEAGPSLLDRLHFTWFQIVR
jgi:hypothetical protein